MKKFLGILKWILIIAFLTAFWLAKNPSEACDLFLTLGFEDKCPEKIQVDNKSI